MGEALLKELVSPYAITYESIEGNTEEVAHLVEIEKQLEQAGFTYTHVSPTYLSMMFRYNDMEQDSRFSMQAMRLSDYNEAAQKLGNSALTLGDDSDSIVIQAAKVNRDGSPLGSSILYQYEDKAMNEAGVEGAWMTLNINKVITNPYLGQQYGLVIVVSDPLYEKLFEHSIETRESTQHGFVVNNWQDTLAVSKKIADAIDYDLSNPYASNNYYYISFLSLNWQLMKQVNGILSILTVLIGIVFFVFACSFLYFRLFTDFSAYRSFISISYVETICASYIHSCNVSWSGC